MSNQITDLVEISCWLD